MAQYIDKDALVAEIKRHLDCCYKICAGNLDFLQKSYPEHYYSIETYKEILSFIDSLQEEPAPKILEDMLNAKTPAESLGISAEEHDRIVDELIYGKEPEMVDIDDLPKEEPVSEDFEKALAREWHGYNDRWAATVDALEDNTQELAFAKGFYRGAQWQKEQMMKDATEVTVHIDAGGYPYIPQMELYDYDKDVPLAKEGGKYKVILIKEK